MMATAEWYEKEALDCLITGRVKEAQVYATLAVAAATLAAAEVES